ncbi:hypothetical protein HDZ31DRAFT_82963 [Schizophyllum fasciatum]
MRCEPVRSGRQWYHKQIGDNAKGQAALDALLSDALLTKAKVLHSQGGPVDLRFHALDISSEASIDAFADYLTKEHGEIDVVVNNAGIAMDGFDANVASTTLRTNYHGTVYATLRFLPLLRPAPTSRLVNVASISGALSKYPPPLRERFRAAAEGVKPAVSPASPADIAHASADIARAPAAATALMREFEDAVRAGTHEARGFPSAAYAVSKAGLIAATRAIARSAAEAARKEGDGLGYPLVNSCCPGYVRTAMSKGRGNKTIDQGARTPVKLALDDLGGIYGEFWQDENVSRW